MAYRNPRCVFVADSIVQAESVSEWLGEQGILADVPEQHKQVQFDVLTFGNQGVQVWVTNPEQAAEATRLLTEREWAKVMKKAEEDLSDKGILVICEECGRGSIFPAGARGTCQNCPHCRAYVDVSDEADELPNEPEDDRPDSDGIQLPPHVRP